MNKLEYQLGKILQETTQDENCELQLFNRINQDDSLLKDIQKYEGEQIDKVRKCSQCGKLMPTGGEVGYFEDERAYSFCDYECMENWNIDHGLEPNGEINFDRDQWHGINENKNSEVN
jgi:hypothetical protein